MNRIRQITRRQLLLWMTGGAVVLVAAFWIPARLVSRAVSRSGPRRHSVRIPTRPFDESELYRPHDLVG